MLKLNFSVRDLLENTTIEKTFRSSVSGVQYKVQLKRQRRGFSIVASGGDYILKPVPYNTYAQFTSDIPANEALTMDIAEKIFDIHVAEHELVEMSNGEYAYLTKRFDRLNGKSIQQEDFCQLSGRTSQSHGDNYKYDSSYEELASLIRQFCPAAAIENPKVFFIIIFNYIFANGDAHLKNFSLYKSKHGDHVLTPAYDLLNTALHFPNEPTATGLEFFADGHYTPMYEKLGFYSSIDFIELGNLFGVDREEVKYLLSLFEIKHKEVETAIKTSFLSTEAQERYLEKFYDRIRAIKQ